MKRKDFLKTLALAPFIPAAMKLQGFKSITDSFSKTEKMPVLFIGHGNPMHALWDNPFTQSLKTLGSGIKAKYRPKAVLVISAHWLTRGSFVSVNPKPQTIHDFGGFPDELFKIQYPAPGSPEFAKEVKKLALEVKEDDEWGLDHGSWTVLKHIFPDADIPVFQLSIDYSKPMQYHFDLSKKLKALREKGVLIMGSGNVVHNLRMMNMSGKTYDWAQEFDGWVKQKIDSRDFESLINYDKQGSVAKLSVPTTDHYIPLLYSLALADGKEEITHTYEGLELGGISMRTLKIG